MVDIGSERDIETVRQVALLLDRENGRLVDQNKSKSSPYPVWWGGAAWG